MGHVLACVKVLDHSVDRGLSMHQGGTFGAPLCVCVTAQKGA